MSLIKCTDLSLGYDGKAILENLNFEINSGDYLCIIGENGAGKSTLMKTLLHLKSPLNGKITYGENLKPNEIGYLPQQTPAQRDFPASVFEVVLSGRLNSRGLKPFYSKEDKKIANEKIELLGIEHLKNKCYRELSGGQQQRVLLARALAATSKMLLMDEPVTGLDPVVTNDFYKITAELNNSGITVIMVSHDVRGSVPFASHILQLGSKQLFFGKKEEYINSDLGKVFMGGGVV